MGYYANKNILILRNMKLKRRTYFGESMHDLTWRHKIHGNLS